MTILLFVLGAVFYRQPLIAVLLLLMILLVPASVFITLMCAERLEPDALSDRTGDVSVGQTVNLTLKLVNPTIIPLLNCRIDFSLGNSLMGSFENEVVSLAKGDNFNLTIPSAEAYGEYMPEGVRSVPKDMFNIDGKFDHEHIFEGAIVPLQDNEGHQFYATITKVDPTNVTVDLNHPYAGKDLTFEGQITEMRDATNEEIQEMINMMSHDGCDCGCEDCEGHHHHDGCGCEHCH